MEQFAPSLTVACPAHGGPDHVRRVSAVYGEATRLTPARLLLSAERLAWVGTAFGVLLVGGRFVRRPPPSEDERAVWYCERCNAVFTEKAGLTKKAG